MINQQTGGLLIAFSLLCVILALKYGSTIPEDITKALSSPAPVFDSASVTRLSTINRAFAASPPPAYFEYTAGFENPFKQWNEHLTALKRSHARSAQISRSTLSLKGILSKSRPLAILENSLGETQIRGVGEKAFDQTILAIADNKVTLRDQLGKYDIIVNEH